MRGQRWALPWHSTSSFWTLPTARNPRIQEWRQPNTAAAETRTWVTPHSHPHERQVSSLPLMPHPQQPHWYKVVIAPGPDGSPQP
jgi:hypothetical protein